MGSARVHNTLGKLKNTNCPSWKWNFTENRQENVRCHNSVGFVFFFILLRQGFIYIFQVSLELSM